MRSLGRFVQHNWVFLLLLACALGIYLAFVVPWLWEAGHQGVSIAGIVIIGLVAVYGRATEPRSGVRRPNVAEIRVVESTAADSDEAKKAA